MKVGRKLNPGVICKWGSYEGCMNCYVLLFYYEAVLYKVEILLMHFLRACEMIDEMCGFSHSGIFPSG